ncbi:hypothetical protein Tco_0690695 [Tanacetum coccineum]
MNSITEGPFLMGLRYTKLPAEDAEKLRRALPTWFSKLINDMRNIKMTMSRMQLNSKFVNNMLPEWSRFITEVKLNRVQDDRVVVQDVRGRYNANNQRRPFQRNNARGNVEARNAGGQNRDGNVNHGQAKPIMCYNLQRELSPILMIVCDDLASMWTFVFEADQCDCYSTSAVDEAHHTEHVHGKSFI